MTDLAKLSAPFAPDRISWRVGSTTSDKKKGMALAYIDARDVMARLDEVCGMAGWQCRYPHANGKTVCEIGIKVEYETENGLRVSEWIWKADGAGDSDVEAEKGALSDAFKRAAVRWGIGRYLYDVASPWVELNERKQFTDTALRQLTALLAGSPPSIKTPAPIQVAPQTAPSPLLEARNRIRDAIRGATTQRQVDDILKANTADLGKIREANETVYSAIIELAENQKADLPKGVAA